MQIGLLTAFSTLSLLGGILLRYIPFSKIATQKQKRLLGCIYAAAMLLNGALVYYTCTTGRFTVAFAKANIIVFGILLAAVNILMIRGRIPEHLFTYGLTAIYNYVLLTVVTYIVNKITGFSGIYDYLAEVIGFCILFAICYPVLRRMMLHTVTPFLTLDSGDYWHTVWFVPVAMYYSCVLSLPGNQHTTSLTHLFSRILICAATIFMCHSIAADHKRLNEKLALDDQLSDQKALYAELSGKVLEARKMRHDFKHHIAAVYRYIETDDRAGLKEYCDQMVMQAGEEAAIPYTGNVAADGVFYRYMQLAQADGVHFEMSGVIRSSGIADVDLCVLLGNALDNAMNGCMTIQEDRYIHVTAEAAEQMLSIMVRNSFDGVVQEKKAGEILSRRRKNKSGIGLESMHSICKKYGGSMEIQYDDSCFMVFILLPLNRDRAELHLHLEE